MAGGGCLGACKVSKCLTYTYGAILVIIGIAQLGASIAAYVTTGDINQAIQGNMEKGMQNYDPEGHEGVTHTWAPVQGTYKCCGANYASDWARKVGEPALMWLNLREGFPKLLLIDSLLQERRNKDKSTISPKQKCNFSKVHTAGNSIQTTPLLTYPLSLYPLFIYSSGVFLVMAGFGCLGACKDSKCLTYTYGVILVIIVIAQLGAGIAAYVAKGDIDQAIQENMEKGMQNYDPEGHEGVTHTWDLVQGTYKCCGVNNASDWAWKVGEPALMWNQSQKRYEEQVTVQAPNPGLDGASRSNWIMGDNGRQRLVHTSLLIKVPAQEQEQVQGGAGIAHL